MNRHTDTTDLAYRLIRRAAHRAPTALAERLEEEWLADLASRSGPAARLRFAIGCGWATSVITRDFRVPQLAAGGAARGHKPLLGELRCDLPLLSRRTAVFVAIAGLHGVLIYAFASGFAQHVAASIPTLMNAVVIEESRPRPAPPPPAVAPTLRTAKIPEIVAEPQDFNFATDNGPDPVPGTPPAPAAGEPAAPRTVLRVPGGPGKGFPTTDDYYPSASRRMAETGVANVQVCVDSAGHLTAEPTLAQTSGSPRIDAAALNLAKAGSGHYRPTTENGTPVQSCYPYRIRFRLSN
jgi:TonB family protein